MTAAMAPNTAHAIQPTIGIEHAIVAAVAKGSAARAAIMRSYTPAPSNSQCSAATILKLPLTHPGEVPIVGDVLLDEIALQAVGFNRRLGRPFTMRCEDKIETVVGVKHVQAGLL